MIRTIFLVTMISSFFGLAVCDAVKRDWRTAIASLLLGVVQSLIFWRGMK
jgi:hypothetical protein